MIMTDVNTKLRSYEYSEVQTFFSESKKTVVDIISTPNGHVVPRYINEFWTSKQRQANSIHEISYRACFKPQLPRFFIEWLTKPGDIVFDPFTGRGTTIIEAALLGRNIISNDINPLSKILCKSRLYIPSIDEVTNRLAVIPIEKDLVSDIDLSMFYHQETLVEILALKNYLISRNINNQEDYIDSWIRMVATNRLTGHSKGFFSVYTLPPNQALLPQKQIKINEQKNQVPVYRNTKKLIINKSRDLLKNITKQNIEQLKIVGEKALFLTTDADQLIEIKLETVQLTVTSPPFLDIVQYADDNWLRCWFNDINANDVSKNITMSKTIDQWVDKMKGVFQKLYRITKKNGYVAFEVGEIRKGKIRLDEYVVDIGYSVGFDCEGIMINEQTFTKTSNIWGVSNNKFGTNSNRIVIFRK
ncbi:MAG: DNA methyltransferase [Bacteroidota bacterium]|nr:DNA methyltransferase [Bacteroidota bacterium]